MQSHFVVLHKIRGTHSSLFFFTVRRFNILHLTILIMNRPLRMLRSYLLCRFDTAKLSTTCCGRRTLMQLVRNSIHIYNTFFSSSLLFVTVTLLKLLILLPWTAWAAGQIRDPKLTEKGRGQAGNLRNDVILKKGLFLHPRIPTWPPSVSLAARFVSTVIIKQGQTWLVE